MIARFFSDDAGRVLSAYATRDDDGHPPCPNCRCGCVSRRNDGLCDDCGASADLHEIAGDDEELAEVVRSGDDERDARRDDLAFAQARDDEYLRWCAAQRDAAIATMDAGAPL